MPFNSLVVFDPSIGTRNLGDEIIMAAINEVVDATFPDAEIERISTQRFPRRSERELMRRAELRIVGGTNLLSSNMDVYRQWRLRDRQIAAAAPALLLGVGWWEYQDPPNSFTRDLLHALLDHRRIHSVRDSYTFQMLTDCGFTNILNTSCPTLWSVTPSLCAQIPTERAPAVVTTVTDYRRSPEHDALMLTALQTAYERVYVWTQGSDDVEYIAGLAHEVALIEGPLHGFDRFLVEHDVDYVGTRLHAGIRAIQAGKRSLIIAVDNRATEIARDVGLNVLDRADVAHLIDVIASPLATEITLPTEAINTWTAQFGSSVPEELPPRSPR